jgi:hypothetical protein
VTDDRDLEARLRRHLAAEADALPFLDTETVHRRLKARPRRWLTLALVPAAALLAVAVVVAPSLLGPGRSQHGDAGGWGPLAVLEMGVDMDALAHGTLRIGDQCVLLETVDGRSELLVWPEDLTSWDEADGTIVFTNPEGTTARLPDGEPVSLGGGQITADTELWLASTDFVSPPDPSCPMETRWYVSGVVAQGNAALPSPQTPTPTPVPSADLVGIIRGEPDLEGGICPVLLTDADGERWEVYLPDGYEREYRGDLMLVIGPAGEVVARTGDRLGFNVERDISMGSHCQAGTPVRATEVVFAQSQYDDPSPPIQNLMEATIADALSVLGLDAQRAEYSPLGAAMWAPLAGDAALFVDAHATGTDRGDAQVSDERVLADITVRTVEYASGLVRERFACGDVTYEVGGSTPPGFPTLDAFLTELIPLLGCSS